MADALPIDDDSDSELLCQWNALDWIGKNKTYRDPPPVVIAARRQVLAIPPFERKLLPHPSLPISRLLEKKLPAQPATLTQEKAASTFARHPATESLQAVDFQWRPIPPSGYIQALRNAFGQAWFDGAQSVIDFRYKHSRLPLHVLTYWDEMAVALQNQSAWRKALGWARVQLAMLADTNLAGKVEGVLDVMAWGLGLRALGASASVDSLTKLLSDQWLDDDIIDMLATDLANRAPVQSGSAVATLAFVHVIMACYGPDATKAEPTSLLERYRDRVLDGSVVRLYFPANLNNNHWVTFLVDFEKRTISYAARIVKGLTAWLKAALSGRPFEAVGPVLTCGYQQDVISCGICAINTIAHHVLGDQLFTPSTRERLRLEYFVIIGKSQIAWGRGQITETAQSTLTGDPREGNMPSPLIKSDSLQAPAVPRAQGSEKAGRSRSDSSEVDDRPLKRLVTNTEAVSDPSTPPSAAPPPDSASRVPNHPSHTSPNDLPIPIHSERRKQAVAEADTHLKSSASRPSGLASGAVGISRSAMAARRLKEAMQRDDWERDPAKTKTFLEELRLLDGFAEVRDCADGSTTILHSRCGEWYTVQGPYSVSRFRQHVNGCGVKKSKKNTKVTAKPNVPAQTNTLLGWTKPVATVKVAGVVTRPRLSQAARKIQPIERTSSLHLHAKNLGWAVKQKELEGEDGRPRKGEVHMSVQAVQASLPGSDAAVEAPHRGPEPSSRRGCTGLTEKSDERIPIYLRRSLVSGGGSQSVDAIAQKMYGQPYRDLSDKQKGIVDDTQVQGRRWRNDPFANAIFSVDCAKLVYSAANGTAICLPCRNVLGSHPFRSALNKAMKKKDKIHHEHLNKKYQSPTVTNIFARYTGLQSLVLDDTPDSNAFTRLAVGLVEGKYDGYPVVGGLMRGLLERQEREERGVGLQNFHYDSSVVEFANMCSIISPELYRLLKEHLPLPSIRGLRQKQNAVPPFPLTIGPQNFETVKGYLTRIGYNGPVALSCDDTKLHAAFRTYWDKEKQVHMLVGGTGEPMAVADPEELQRVLADPTLKKATKLRLWCAQIPLSKFPPIIVAAKAIPNSLTVSDLHALVMPILDGLLTCGINVCSYACDGTETERSLQRRLVEKAPYRLTY
ncbi:hypothetical protein K466DRAFT_656140 [Polyporus arcularius HHB13444]|uniref:Ubiquitin-like protease family profile domain-containing protein n=1 Tax=Polyporus arcularius HHB13444 TaxID=1314778 RepID=A0A5C3NVG9_9APHY|nr:hypothetical protein K466DRAFT_656140 [Polyporus arcularius HHB13444]